MLAENCSNGIDDDGDGFIDGADPDCGCLQTIMMVARDNGQILSVNLATGGSSSVATSSPYVTGNLNALAANANKNLVYYCANKKVYYWVPSTGVHGQVFDLNGYINNSESLSSGGGEYYNGYLYLGTENGNPGSASKIWRLQLSADGKSGVGAPVNLNVPIPNQLSWGDMIATSEGGQTVIYGMAAAGTSSFFKYNVSTSQYTLIRNDLPTEMQIGVDIQGNAWAGSLSSGSIQKINRTTGYFYGNIITFGGKIWDLTGPINCPQAIEICGNGIDDDHDGYIDNQDQDCLCPVITPNDVIARTICEGEMVSFNVNSNAPKPPYSYIEFYRFNTIQTNPYLSTDAKTWLGEFTNINGTGNITSNNFPNATNSNTTYYVYGIVKPAPQYPATCAPLVQYTVVVKPAPTVNTGSDIAICGGTSATISAVASNAPSPFTYNWSNGLGAGASKTVAPLTNTTYIVTATASNGCTTTDDVAVILNPAPIVNAGLDVSICNGLSTTLTAVGSGGVAPYSYNWDNGLGAGASKTVSAVTTKTYTVTITGGNGCVATDQVTVTSTNCVENCTNGIDDNGDGLVDCADPTCGITPNSGDNNYNTCPGSPVTFTVSATGGTGPYTFVWNNGLGTGPTKTVSPLVTKDYTVTITPSVGCTATKTVHVGVIPCPEDCSNDIDDDNDGLIDCQDPDCALVGAPQLVNDNFSTCSGAVLIEQVIFNDGNLQNPLFSIFTQSAHGSVIIDNTGKFTYTPTGSNCGTDAFVYQVCNQPSGCCAQATVNLLVGDTQAPVMVNLPPDEIISCDDAVPVPTQVLATDNCPGIFMQFSEGTTQHVNGTCESYDITRTWTATDLCGNSTVGKQVITVQDLTPPEIQRLYTLSNGKKLISGKAALTSERWKYVSFPVNFSTVPLIFPQITSEVEAKAVAVQVRNISTQGFELRLVGQEAKTGKRQPETVSWLAIQKGSVQNSSFGFDAGSAANITSTSSNVNYALSFSSPPGLIAALQTTNQADPSSLRFQSISNTNAQVFIAEETSFDGETTHAAETMAYLALTPGVDITDTNGEVVGETGTLSLTNAWGTFPMRRKYTKPIVIMGGLSLNNGEPTTIRVNDVTSNDFKARLQEWPYQDGTHVVEQVSYFIVEGSIPAKQGYYCQGKASNIVVGQNIFARDNCDNQVEFNQAITESMQATGMLTTRSWTAIDDCGSTIVTTRKDTCTIAALRLKAILHGAFLNNAGDGLMRDELRTKGWLPTQEPYTAINTFQHKGKGGGEILQPSLLQATGPNAIVDWVFVEIRDSVNIGNVLVTKSALLQRDGDVVSADGSDLLIFPSLQEGKYHVALRHRNHIGMMTDATVYLSSFVPPLVDFTDPKMGVKGWNEAGKLANGKRTLWPGDFNSDRKVIYQGPSNDIFSLFSRVVADPQNTSNLANYISLGYDRNDLNLDGKVIYQGPGNERASLLYYTILAHPTNLDYLANFIVKENLP